MINYTHICELEVVVVVVTNISRQTKISDLQDIILSDKDVTGRKVTM